VCLRWGEHGAARAGDQQDRRADDAQFVVAQDGDPDLEALSLMTMSAGLGTSVIGGHSSVEQAQAVIDYQLSRIFPNTPASVTPLPQEGDEPGGGCS
jgi:hypothetical protein